ncbi:MULTISPECIES: DNA-directed RNA polymerase subunit alpha C-terminal domain-containing protein [unclassified Pseudomonas]|uniref:DNA-directed RNA polymerase subunit alpha C-terminal domain-containing protein n=1 Tax=unclassified Pseudomonas TaxID=196821 RepID=UPI0008392490|nr:MULTISPECIES: DNA-directed RNA polymerase subunit alpha C-terminal domain-containing protein [unclassified Pseudomonas]QIH09009.1 hypothetical protein ATY02_20865 [Pseudomonas sp. BIOMIG1BAC]
MKPEFRIREVTRYAITRFDERGTHPVAQVDNRETAEQIVSALAAQAEADSLVLGTSIDDLNFSTRTRNNLIVTCGLSTLEDLTKINQVQLLGKHRVGVETLKEVLQLLNDRGLKHQLGRL